MAFTFDKIHRPPTIMERLLEIQAVCQPMPGGPPYQTFPAWYTEACKDDPAKALRELVTDAIDEIEMHRNINGQMYKKLYGD